MVKHPFYKIPPFSSERTSSTSWNNFMNSYSLHLLGIICRLCVNYDYNRVYIREYLLSPLLRKRTVITNRCIVFKNTNMGPIIASRINNTSDNSKIHFYYTERDSLIANI